jgi:hypothetical protein
MPRASHVQRVAFNAHFVARGARAERVCGNAAKWDEFDASAVDAGVTCRWEMGVARNKLPGETCLTAAPWQQVDEYPRRALPSVQSFANAPVRNTPETQPFGRS